MFLVLSYCLKSYFIFYGGYVLYMEAERNVPSMHIGNKVLWGVILLYDIVISVVMIAVEDSAKVPMV